MKKNLSLLLILSYLYLNAQYGNCKCGDDLDRDIRTYETNFSRSDAKNLIYEYFKDSNSQRRNKKRNLSYGTTVNTIINSLPVRNESFLNFGSENTSISKVYSESINKQFVSDENLNILISTFLPNRAFDVYEKCLKRCNEYAKITSNGGVKFQNVSDSDDIVVLRFQWISNPPGNRCKISNVTYSSGSIIGGKKLKEGLIVNDRQIIYEQIKLNLDESFVATVNLEEGCGDATYSIPPRRNSLKSKDFPLGAIVASILDYESFLTLNGLEIEDDINKALWVPCDGRRISTDSGTYGAKSNGTVPDLRGLFLRGINDMGNSHLTTPEARGNHLNPDNKRAGQFQQDALQDHKHNFIGYGSTGSGLKGGGNETVTTSGILTSNDLSNPVYISSETRPKNMTVYYYIKIR